MDFVDALRRLKRLFDTNYVFRRLFILTVILFGLIWIFGFRLLPFDSSNPSESRSQIEHSEGCLERRLKRFEDQVNNMDANILHIPALPNENQFLPYIGNGYIGSSLHEEATINIKLPRDRTIRGSIPFRPVVRVAVTDELSRKEAFVSHYFKGTVQRISCIDKDASGVVEVASTFFAHRTFPSVIEQDVTMKNPSFSDTVVQFDHLGWSGDPPFSSQSKTMQQGDGEITYILGSGVIDGGKNGLMAVSVAYKKVPNAIQIKAREVLSQRFVTVVNYVEISNRKEFDTVKNEIMEKSESELKKVLSQNGHNFITQHEAAWMSLWNTGFYISPSRAENAINGNQINATVYAVLTQVRAPLQESGTSAAKISEANSVLSYTDGCYGGHHTLQAQSLWLSWKNEEEFYKVCNLWLITLEKLGCHNLLKAGASGVIQGMVLSFGGLRFRNSHLEFNTEPKDLHRDYHFRRIWYGNSTHVNISVSVGGDNKASLFVALDRSDKDYYACDAGCLDTPVALGPTKKQFPVKITDPATSILYITADKKHAEELHFSIHVKEILEAPAHEHHVISMHKHGSGYGAMSTMFWAVLSVLIVLFHLFLFHLVYTEYFGPSQDKFRSRKISDF